MQMKNVIFVFFFLFIALMSINAQSNFRPGYIITHEKDTIAGLIDFRTYKMNAQFCKFKTAAGDNEKIYYPENIYGYRFTNDGKYYVSKEIEIEGKPEQVFLEFLIQGIISLYFYPGEESEYYFFQEESGKMIPVTKQDQKEVLRETVDKGRKVNLRVNLEDNRYKGIIRYIFKDSESVLKATDKMSFTQVEIIDLTKKYHAEMCKTGEECIEFTTKPDKYTKIKISVYAGIQSQTYKVVPRYSNLSSLVASSLPPDICSLAPEIGVQLNSSIPRWNKSISCQLDVSLAPFKNEQEDERRMRLKLAGLVASGKLGGKYTYHKGLFRPVMEAGLMINCLFMSSNDYRDHYFEVNDFVKSPLYGFYAGIGLDYHLKKENALFFRIVYDNCRFLTLGDTMTTLQLKLGYTF